MTSTFTRRRFVRAAALGGAATAGLAKPAIAQSAPEVRWRLASSFPRALDTMFGAADVVAKAVAEATDNRFRIDVHAGGELMPGLQVADAVTNGTIEAGHTASYYSWTKDPTFAFGTAVPFGLNCRMQNAWINEAGGLDLLNAFYAKHGIIAFPAGNTGAQMGGWFRKEVNSLQDLDGLRMRIGGFGGQVLTRVGGRPADIAGGDIYAALEKGEIDAAEWVGPYDDEKLSLFKVARYYYYPGWWEGGSMLQCFFNLEAWSRLPKSYQAILRSACHRANEITTARYDTLNPAALKRLVASGATLRPFNEQVLEGFFRAANEVYDEISAGNAEFKKIYEHLKAFRAESYLWFQLPEFTYDSFLMIQQRKRLL